MLEGIIQIGDSILKGSKDMISNYVQDLEPLNRKGRERHVCKLYFYSGKDDFKIDCKEEIGSDTAAKYSFIGSADGPNSPQWYATSSSYIYLITETMYNLQNIDFGSEINLKIKNIFQKYYVDLGEPFKSKNRYILNFKKLGISEEDALETLKNTLQKYADENEKEKYKNAAADLKKIFQKQFEDFIKDKCDMKKDEIGLYTIFIDDRPLCSFSEYKNAAVESKKKSKKKKSIEGCCSICGKTDNLTEDLSKMKIKYYTTNQIIFASNFKNYSKNMILCENCLNSLTAGENYIKNKLDTRLMGFTVYLIPHFVFGTPMDKDELDYVSERIQNSFNTVKSIKSTNDFETSIKDLKDLSNEKNYFLINILFYKRSNQATKIQKLIKDISPTIFQEMMQGFYETIKLSKNVMGNNFKLILDLQTFYFMTPIRLKNSEPMQYRNLLQMYDAIFEKRPMKKDEFIKNVIYCARIKYFDEAGYNINKSSSIEKIILQAGFCMKFLEYMTCLKEEEKMDVDKLKVNANIKNYIDSMGYGEEESALFLLGYLVGAVGNAQYKRMGQDRKPILNKLNFGGVDRNKIIRLCDEVFGKLVQEKIRLYNETTFAECKKLLDKNIKNWKLNKYENLFYILSGYSFKTESAMINKGGKENEK